MIWLNKGGPTHAPGGNLRVDVRLNGWGQRLVNKEAK
jgi:hypothetical protein